MQFVLQRILEKRANVATAGGAVTAPGSQNMPGKGYGAANIPGMSIHCLKCGMKHEQPKKVCPKCGNDTSHILDLKEQGPEYAESGETGGEAATNEERAKAEGEKRAFVDYAKLPKQLKYAIGAGAAVAGTYGAVKLNQLLKPPVEKVAGVRAGNPILNLRKPQAKGDVRKALARMLRAAKKSRVSQMRPRR